MLIGLPQFSTAASRSVGYRRCLANSVSVYPRPAARLRVTLRQGEAGCASALRKLLVQQRLLAWLVATSTWKHMVSLLFSRALNRGPSWVLTMVFRCHENFSPPSAVRLVEAVFQGFKGPPLARECLHSMTCLLNLLLFERASMI